MFPSPCGEKVGINKKALQDWLDEASIVSVPLRGKGRDQRLEDYVPHYYESSEFPSPCGEKVGINVWYFLRLLAADYMVSVPLRGKGRDQRFIRGGRVERYYAVFPSPCGEKVGINVKCSGVVPIVQGLFPSPCGEKVGINSSLLH